MIDTVPSDALSESWLDQFPLSGDVHVISENRPFLHNENDYDTQYLNTDLEDSGRGIVNLLRNFDCDSSGPILELGCGTGVATIGICKHHTNPLLLVTDSSTAFLDLVKRKLDRNSINMDRIKFAVLSDGDLDRLPENSVSAIVLRSVVHHFLDVPGWIRSASRILRPGGVIVAEEPCAQGYLIMGIIAQSAAYDSSNGLTDEQRAKAQVMADTMKAYNRCDVDKSDWEDKHLFRPHEISGSARAVGLDSYFIGSASFENFAGGEVEITHKGDFHAFYEDYLRYCMSFGEADAARIAEVGAASCNYIREACSGTREPLMMGLFILKKQQVSPP